MRFVLKTENFYSDRRIFTLGYDYSDVPTLFEADDARVGDLLDFQGRFFSVCLLSHHHRVAVVEPVDIGSGSEEDNEDFIKCPVCGCENDDSWECADEDDNYECGRCCAVLSYTSQTTRTFYVRVVERPVAEKVLTQCLLTKRSKSTYLPGGSPGCSATRKARQKCSNNI